jgi:hypothetical protein
MWRYCKQWNEANPEYRNAYDKARKKTDALYALTRRARNLVNNAFSLKGYRKNTKTEKLIGCSFKFLLRWLGEKPTLCAAVDHVIPLATAKCEQDIISLNHWTNLRYLSAAENLEKRDKLTFSFADRLEMTMRRMNEIGLTDEEIEALANYSTPTSTPSLAAC